MTDTYGGALTPREIHQAINSLIFLYPGMRDFVCISRFVPTPAFHLVTNPPCMTGQSITLTERSVSKPARACFLTEKRQTSWEELYKVYEDVQGIHADSFLTLADWLPVSAAMMHI